MSIYLLHLTSVHSLCRCSPQRRKPLDDALFLGDVKVASLLHAAKLKLSSTTFSCARPATPPETSFSSRVPFALPCACL